MVDGGQEPTRCRRTGVMLPECGCHFCCLEMVRQRAPRVVAGDEQHGRKRELADLALAAAGDRG